LLSLNPDAIELLVLISSVAGLSVVKDDMPFPLLLAHEGVELSFGRSVAADFSGSVETCFNGGFSREMLALGCEVPGFDSTDRSEGRSKLVVGMASDDRGPLLVAGSSTRRRLGRGKTLAGGSSACSEGFVGTSTRRSDGRLSTLDDDSFCTCGLSTWLSAGSSTFIFP